jgi:hypothetical protein
MAPVGAGNLNALPGNVADPVTATNPFGVDPKWQDSQTVDDGMCLVAPNPDEDGMTTILLMPVKLVFVIDCPWQVLQPVVIPRWLYNDPENKAPFTTGNCRLLPGPTWHVSHGVLPNGTCLASGALIVKAADGIE